MATIAPGMRVESMRQASMVATVANATMVACDDQEGKLAANAFMRNQNSPGTVRSCNPKKSLIWVLAISTAMPLVKPMTRNKLNRGAHTGGPKHDQQNSGHHRTHEKPINAVRSHDTGYHHDEGASRAANLGFRTSQR